MIYLPGPYQVTSVLIRRLETDRPSINPQDHFSYREVARSLKSPHVLIVFVMFYMIGTTLYGLGLFLPSQVKQLGFSATKTQLLSVGPFAAGFFGNQLLFEENRCLLQMWILVTLMSAYFADRYNARAIPTALISCFAIAGFAMYLSRFKCRMHCWLLTFSNSEAEGKYVAYG